MTEPFTATSTVGALVAADFRRAAVLEEFNIDFCCNGRRSLAEACRAASANIDDVVRALDAMSVPSPSDTDATRWSVTELVAHIESVHHAYVRDASPRIAQHLAKIVEAHGERHPELARVAAYFEQIREELAQHMVKEERILFPYICDLNARPAAGAAMRSPFGSVENPIRMMEREHDEAGSGLRLIRELTHAYTTPDDGCTTYAVTMAELSEFERDLHRHIHLENNILFPAAVRLEASCLEPR